MSFFLNTTVCGFSLYHILAFFLIYSCLGWCVEVVYAAATTGQLVNRGFLNGPVCPIYGFGMILVLFFLTPLEDNLLLLYLGGVILPSALELVGGWALYKLYRTRWWDYSDYPFNIGGYICLEFCLLWGVGTLVVLRIVHPIIAGLVAMVPTLVGVIMMCILYAVYATAVVATAIAASTLADTLDTMEKLGDSIHAVSDAMTELLGTTAMTADQKMDESRLQLKLAAAEARDNGPKLKPREAMAAIRARTDEAMETARRASETARLNAAEAANAAKLAAQGASERAAERAAALLHREVSLLNRTGDNILAGTRFDKALHLLARGFGIDRCLYRIIIASRCDFNSRRKGKPARQRPHMHRCHCITLPVKKSTLSAEFPSFLSENQIDAARLPAGIDLAERFIRQNGAAFAARLCIDLRERSGHLRFIAPVRVG